MKTTVDMQWTVYVHGGSHICSEAYVSNVKCIFISVPGHIIDHSQFIWGTCVDIVVSYVDMKKLA